MDRDPVGPLRDHVIICGYGRIGQSVGHFLEEEKIPYVAIDLDSSRVRDAHLAGEAAFYGDSANREVLKGVGVGQARLLVISHEDFAAATETLRHVRSLHPELPVMVRTRDDTHVEELRKAGATEVVPETLEAGLMIASQALLLLDVPQRRVMRRMQEQRRERYRLLREQFRGDPIAEIDGERDADRLRVVPVAQESAAAGRALADFDLSGIGVTALVRQGKRLLTPTPDTRLEAGDAVVLFGSPDDLQRAERDLLR